MSPAPTVTATQQMQDLLDQAMHSDCSRQRHALSSIGYRAQMAGITPLAFLRDYFFAQFQSVPPRPDHKPAFIETSPVLFAGDRPETPILCQCRSCGKTFATQTALNGHGETRCAMRKNRPIQS